MGSFDTASCDARGLCWEGLKPYILQIALGRTLKIGGFKSEVQHLLPDEVSRWQAHRRRTANSDLKIA